MAKNNVGILVDRSGSMSNVLRQTVQTVNDWINKVREESQKSGIPTTMSFGVFDNQYDLILDKISINQLRSIEPSDVQPRNSTSLCEAVVKSIDNLKKGQHDQGETYLLITVTDGQENTSNEDFRAALPRKIQECIKEGTWTLVFLCPPGGKRALMQWGVYDDNIQEWAGREGLEYSRGQTISALDTHYNSLASGQTASRSFFQKVTTDMGKVKTGTVKAKLQDETKNYQLVEVTKEAVIEPFVTGKGYPYYLGRAFYQLMKPEKVQVGKEVMVMDKKTKVVYSGQYARELIGLNDPNQAYKVTPGNHANYEIFIQSKSVNRILPRGTKVLIHR